jgi:lipopolysaccharide/colanic/teichoic acid biosynthesis glycosyltransferase
MKIDKLLHQNFTPDIYEIARQCKTRPLPLMAKRVFDVLLTLPVTVFLLPVFLIIAVFIKLDSAGPVIFKQKRVGKKEKLFKIYKFRTMLAGTEKLGKYFICEHDTRITRVGKILRKYKIDELPQLFNVLRGEMSLVGPRPMIPKIVDQYPPSVRKVVLSVPPGITGIDSIVYIDESEMLESVSNPTQLYTNQIIPMKLYYYLNYVRMHNIWLDLQIIFLTLVYIIRFLYNSFRKNELSKLNSKLP